MWLFQKPYYMKNKVLVIAPCLLFIILLALFPFKKYQATSFHTEEELAFFLNHKLTPIDTGEYFLTPQNCKGCHGFDTMGIANVDINGNDVNLYDDWETSMMGLSGVDPLWKAKVSHEILVNPAHANELQTLCTSCHAPMGHYSAMYKGQTYYTLADLATDTLGQAGVACGGCHAIGDSSDLGALFTGQIPYDTNHVLYGPFDNPVVGPMQLYVGLIPTYSTHVSESRFCSPCHTLISNTVDLAGNPTGGTFVEQATYHEWLNSVYPAQPSTCQTCHMPEIEDPVKLANGYTALPGRSPFNLHKFAGGNSFMVKLIKDNKVSLGVNADDKNFDSTLAVINDMLTKQSLTVTAHVDSILADTAYLNVSLLNKAGHKFPSGYPSRRAVLQLLVTKSNGDTLFASGMFDNNYEVQNIATPFEAHHDVITAQTQSQIYQLVMGDVNGDVTTVLERAATPLTDNRIPPVGFTDLHYTYDTCKIVGNALTDANFNKNGITQGTGKDIVYYNVGLNGYSGIINISASVYYQAVPPGWLTEMSTFSSAEIDTFLTMYNNADKSPVLVGSDTLLNIVVPVGVETYFKKDKITVWPNPTFDNKVLITSNGASVSEITLFNQYGKKVFTQQKKINVSTTQIMLPKTKGIYHLSIKTSEGIISKKILNL